MLSKGRWKHAPISTGAQMSPNVLCKLGVIYSLIPTVVTMDMVSLISQLFVYSKMNITGGGDTYCGDCFLNQDQTSLASWFLSTELTVVSGAEVERRNDRISVKRLSHSVLITFLLFRTFYCQFRPV